MIEALKHTLGICGEHWHPNIFTFLVTGVASLPGISYLKYKFKRNK